MSTTKAETGARTGRESREQLSTPLSGRSRKRAVSTGGGDRSDSRLVYTNTPLLPLDASLKSFSLGFNFHPPTPGTVSFTSTSSGKWWKSKFGLKKLVNSVRRKKKPLSKKEFSPQALLEKSELDLKKRRLDFAKDFRHKSFHTPANTFSQMEDPTSLDSLASPVQQSPKEKMPLDLLDEASTTPPAKSSPGAKETIGPGGEDPKQRSNSTSPALHSEKDTSFRTPSHSKSDLTADSDASFVMCETIEAEESEDYSSLLTNATTTAPSQLAPSSVTNALPRNVTPTSLANALADPCSKSSANTTSISAPYSKAAEVPQAPAAGQSQPPEVPTPTSSSDPSANHSHSCCCACVKDGRARAASPGSAIVLIVAMILGLYFQYFYVFPFLKDLSSFF